MSLQFGDLGHQRGSEQGERRPGCSTTRAARSSTSYLRGERHGAPAAGQRHGLHADVPARRAAPAGPFTRGVVAARSTPGAVRFALATAQTVTRPAATRATATAIDPVGGGGDACARPCDAETRPGTAVYRCRSTGGFTLMGLPTVSAEDRRPRAPAASSTPPLGRRARRQADAGLARRATGSRTTRRGRVTFQLFGNGYRFEPGHTAKLELLGRRRAVRARRATARSPSA